MGYEAVHLHRMRESGSRQAQVPAGNNYHGQISVVANMAETVEEGRKVYRQIAKVAMRFLNRHIYDGGVLLRDNRLAATVRQRKTVVLAYPKAEISSSLAALATKLGTGSVLRSNGEGFLKKVSDWFF